MHIKTSACIANAIQHVFGAVDDGRISAVLNFENTQKITIALEMKWI